MEPPPNGPTASTSAINSPLDSSFDMLNHLWKQEVTRSQANEGNNASSNGKPPPIPPRPHETSVANRSYSSPMTTYGGLGSPYGGFGYGLGSYGGYGGYGYGGYGGYGSRYGMYGQGAPNENDFVTVAEESTRQAFQSIESIVHAFGSVSMMLESTYFAVHSSFRAVLGVADHFSRLKGHMTQVISSLALIKTLTWYLRRLACMLGLSDIDPNDEQAWREASAQGLLSTDSIAEALSKSNGKSSWPIMIFFAVVLGTPWLIWKLLLRISGADSQRSRWMLGEGDHYVAVGLYDFNSSNPREVSFRANQQLIIAPKELQPNVRGWLLASVDGKQSGLIPASYVKVVAFNQPSRILQPDASGDHLHPNPHTSAIIAMNSQMANESHDHHHEEKQQPPHPDNTSPPSPGDQV